MTANDFHQMLAKTMRLNPAVADAPLSVFNGGEVSGLGLGGDGLTVMDDCRPKVAHKSSLEYFTSILTLAGFEILASHQIANDYWPRCYLLLSAENPWWLFKTQHGLIKIGWRKHVISIEWDFVKVVPTCDGVTKAENMVHAYSPEKAIEYLRVVRETEESVTADPRRPATPEGG